MRFLTIVFSYLVKAPLSGLYGLAIYVRHKLYDWKIFKSTEFSFPIINVGNLTVGGTGKTPHIEYILSLLPESCKAAVLSRGYKRKSKGFQYVQVTDSADMAGDEPLQIKTNFPEFIVSVEADRVKGVKKLIKENKDLELVLLDDAFQHRSIKTNFNIVLIDYNRPIYTDHLLPWGHLRDSKSQLHRAEVVIVTKCPTTMSPVDMRMMSKQLNLYPYQKLFFTTTAYAKPKAVFDDADINMVTTIQQAIIVAGIATPNIFVNHIKQCYTKEVKPFIFRDHYNFTKKDIQRICLAAQTCDVVFTTQKDSQRLLQWQAEIPAAIQAKFFYIPIEIVFLRDKELFTQYILNYVRTNKNNSSLY